MEDAVAAAETAYRPLAVIETDEGSAAYLGGTELDVMAQAASLGGDTAVGLVWPARFTDTYQFALRVPPGRTQHGVMAATNHGFSRFQAAHGVGEVKLATDTPPDVGALVSLRTWAEAEGGALVVERGFVDAFDAWGTPPDSLELQRQVKAAFDPVGVSNPGRLPGGL